MITKRRRNLIFIEALILSLIVYAFMIILNGYLDEKRINELDFQITNTSTNFLSFASSESFYQNIDVNSSQNQKHYIFKNYEQLKKLGTDLSNYGKLFLGPNENISKLKAREYFLNQLYIFEKVLDYNDRYDDDIYWVVYFFNSENSGLDKQSLILDQFVLNHENESIVFSFDINYEDEPILENLKTKYNVTFSPFIITYNSTTRNMNNENLIVDLNAVTIDYKKFRGEI